MFRAIFEGFVSSHPTIKEQSSEISFVVTVKTESNTTHAVCHYVLPTQNTDQHKSLYETLSKVQIGDNVHVEGNAQIHFHDKLFVWIDEFSKITKSI